MEHYLGNERCACGKVHTAAIDEIVIGKDAVKRLPGFIRKYECNKPFLLADCNTFSAAGKVVCDVLDDASISYSKYVFSDQALEPNEESVGSAIMHFDKTCDMIIGIGSGVINDIGKILSNVSGRKYIIVGTAPSMDGYASATSSMSMDGLKVSLSSRCADVIIGDTDILKTAPDHMLKAGLGDMLAKYVSIAEWRIAHEITGEYYCERVAELIRGALKKCIDNAEKLLKRDDEALEAVFEGLVIGGVAMAYAGVSRPASGVEHYFSHVWDMRGLEFGTQVDLHGIQCAIGTMQAVKLYEEIIKDAPNEEKAKAYVDSFDYESWKAELREFLGNSAETMIALEAKEKKYDKSTHPARFKLISKKWDAILTILKEELPDAAQLLTVMNTIGISTDPKSIGVTDAVLRKTFKASKDIRDKYVLSRLAWDLGVLDELCDTM